MTIMIANPYAEDMILYNDIPDPAHVCPTCRTDWFLEGFHWVASDGMTVETFPQAGNCCPYCAAHEATEDQLYKAIKLAGAERLVVGHLLNVGVRDSDTTADIMDAIRQHMPDAFTDSCRDVLEDGLLEYLLEVLKDEA
jgi:hypothetical protein